MRQVETQPPHALALGGPSAFTLIELLVVISVVALLIGILLPTLAASRRTANQTREQSAIRQLSIGYSVYATDNRDKLMPGYLRGSWASAMSRQFVAYDANQNATEDNRVVGAPLRPYPWRIMSYIDFSLETLICDRELRRESRERVADPADPGGYHMSIARNPSFGLNTTYLGGDAHRGGFTPLSTLRWGSFYVTRLDQPIATDKLIVFATSRGILRDTGGRKVPGYHRIEGPWHATPTSNSVPAFLPWTGPRGRFDPSLDTTAYGHVDFRHFGRAGAVMFDGHADMFSVDQMFDMRRWCNRASDANWRPL